jgi:short-subunit dehydrogenase
VVRRLSRTPRTDGRMVPVAATTTTGLPTGSHDSEPPSPAPARSCSTRCSPARRCWSSGGGTGDPDRIGGTRDDRSRPPGGGRAVVRELARRGYALGLLARGQNGLSAAAAEAEAAGVPVLTQQVDVAVDSAVQAAADRIETELGPIDLWVNAAFSTVFAPFIEVSAEEYARATEVTYLGFVNGTRAALRYMLPRDRGAVVQVGSALAYRGIPLQSVYCGAKHAIQGFNEALRCELLHDRSRVRVTMVQMPAVNTPQFDWVLSRLPHHPKPVPPIFQPEVVARAVVYAAEHPGRREYWVGASTAATLIANAIVPGLLDRYLARSGYRSQQTRAEAPRLPANLWHPSDQDPGSDQGAHGSFDSRASDRSQQVWASQHRGLLAAGAAMATLAVASGVLFGRRR